MSRTRSGRGYIASSKWRCSGRQSLQDLSNGRRKHSTASGGLSVRFDLSHALNRIAVRAIEVVLHVRLATDLSRLSRNIPKNGFQTLDSSNRSDSLVDAAIDKEPSIGGASQGPIDMFDDVFRLRRHRMSHSGNVSDFHEMDQSVQSRTAVPPSDSTPSA